MSDLNPQPVFPSSIQPSQSITRKKSKKPLIAVIIVIFIIAVIAGLVRTSMLKDHYAEIKTKGIQTIGTACDTYKGGGTKTSNHRYHVIYCYTVEGKEYRVTNLLQKATYREQKVTIYYLESDYSEAAVGEKIND